VRQNRPYAQKKAIRAAVPFPHGRGKLGARSGAHQSHKPSYSVTMGEAAKRGKTQRDGSRSHRVAIVSLRLLSRGSGVRFPPGAPCFTGPAQRHR
jgi:hypothetical protein